MEESTDPQLILVKQNKTWEEALDYCRSYYTDLASLRSDEENDWAAMKSQMAETEHLWIGLHYVAKYWIWVNGYALEYKAWSEDGHPKCPGSSHRCGALETEEKTWKPRDCEEKLNFLCLKKLTD
ncbi:snaclec echicetin subunit beta-like [Colossoma macropomum]|uniref:snaclec echicetin subunit beta-like n=1 Tax=Colossoma macropomum TaxID=42526 RepID=UPI0018640FCB|nr:snaclec echicetin subunit beta-like [Colossoma macropomum]